MITRRPITTWQVQEGAQALWDRFREQEGRVVWSETASWVRQPYEQQAQLVLETAIPQDAERLRAFGEECLRVADIL